VSNLLYILLAVLMFGVLVFLHEAGHYLAARLTGVGVKEFAMGFGPKLFSRVSPKTGIRYSLRALPFGGFCGFYDEYSENEEEKNRPDSFQKAAVWKRLAITVSGPLMNLVTALLLLVLLYAVIGLWGVSSTISQVVDGMPAKEAGFLPGDRIAQLVITPVLQPAYEVAQELDDTCRSSGGFGSTGK